MARPSHLERLRQHEAVSLRQRKVKERIQLLSTEMIRCHVCKRIKPMLTLTWGTGGELGCEPVCSQTCREEYRRKLKGLK